MFDEAVLPLAGTGVAAAVGIAEGADVGEEADVELGAAVGGSVGVAVVGVAGANRSDAPAASAAGGVLLGWEPGCAGPPQVATRNSVPSSRKPMAAACLRLSVGLCIVVSPSLTCKSCGLPSLRLPVPSSPSFPCTG